MAYINRRDKPDRTRICGSCEKKFYPVNGKQECCEDCKANGNRSRYFRRKCRGKYIKPPLARYQDYQRGAITRAYKFDLTFEQFMVFWQKPCWYCGAEIKTIGLDRMNNKYGYAVDNVVPCCWPCNQMKGGIDPSIFIDRCKAIASNFDLAELT